MITKNQEARAIIITAKAQLDLGPDLGGYSGVDLILDQMETINGFLDANEAAEAAQRFITHNLDAAVICECPECELVRPALMAQLLSSDLKAFALRYE